MIRHIVFFTSADPADADAVYEGLSLLAGIPDADHFEVGRNQRTDALAGPAPDFVVYAEFKDEAALNAFKAHPLYAEAIRIVRPLRDMRIAADFIA